MNFTGLKYFLEVARDGNITKTADRLHISQQSLSAHMSKLEKELGVRLFERNPAFSLTYAGERILALGGNILELENEIFRECSEIADGERCKLNIGISYTCGRAVLPRILPAFAKLHPMVEFTLMEGNSAELREWLTQGTIDIVIGFEPIDKRNAEFHRLRHEQLFLVVPKEMTRELFGDRYEELYAENLQEADVQLFSHLPFIMIKRGNRSRAIFDSFMMRSGFDPNVILETESIETALALAEEGMGATVYSELFLSFIHPSMKNPANRHADFFPLNVRSQANELMIGQPLSGYRPRLADEFVKMSIELLSDA